MHNRPLEEAGVPSRLTTDPDYQSHLLNPIRGAAALFKDANPAIDWILCPGDLSDKADVRAQRAAWEELESLRLALHAQKLISTTGNHDVESHAVAPGLDPNASQRALNPRFPIRDAGLWKRYWKKHFVQVRNRTGEIGLFIVNSCRFHDPTDIVERERGRITDGLIADIKNVIDTSEAKINILMLHHHIRQHPFARNDNSHAHNGAMLLEILRESGKNWLVLHGHQHMPDIRYFEGGLFSPLVFSAGSVAAETWRSRSITPRNQIYLIDLDVPADADPSQSLRGTIQSWDWVEYNGWIPASPNSGLPRLCGFGYRGDLADLITRMRSAIKLKHNSRMSWDELSVAVTDVKNIIPSDMIQVLSLLERDGVNISYDKYGFPKQFEEAILP